MMSSSSSPPSRPNPPWQRQTTASYSPSDGELPHVQHLERRRQILGGRRLGGELDEVRREVDAVGRDAPPRQRERVPPRPAPDVEHLHPRFEPELATRKSISCSVPFVNEFPEVGRAQELRDLVEPRPVRTTECTHADARSGHRPVFRGDSERELRIEETFAYKIDEDGLISVIEVFWRDPRGLPSSD